MYFVQLGSSFIGRARIWERHQLLSREAEQDSFDTSYDAERAIESVQPEPEVGPLGFSPEYERALGVFTARLRRSFRIVQVVPRIVAIKRDCP